MKNKIMVLDDDKFYVEQLNQMLEERGYDVLASTVPEKGLELLESFAPDVLLVDWRMPNTSGIDIIKMIRGKMHNEQIYIIMLSGNIMTDDIVNALSTGANDYVIKPFTEEELVARVNNGIRHNRIQKISADGRKKILSELNKLESALQQLTSALPTDNKTSTVIRESKNIFASIRETMKSFQN